MLELLRSKTFDGFVGEPRGRDLETRSTSIEKPKIPDVCDVEGIETIDLIEIVRREGWSFRSP